MVRIILKLFIISTIVFASSDAIFTQEEKNYIQKNPTVSIGMLNEFRPYSYIEEGEHQGFDLALLQQIEAISGLKFEIQTGFWPSIFSAFKYNHLDMIADISYTPQREAFTLYTKPYYEIPNYIFTLKDNHNYIDNLSLINKKVAVTKDKFYNEELIKLGIHLKQVDSTLQKIDLLLKGEVDYYLTNFEPNDVFLIKKLEGTLKVIDTLYFIDKEDLRFGIHKSKPLLYTIIQKSLSMIDETTMMQLQKKWLMAQPVQSSHLDLSTEEISYIENNPVITYSEIDWKPLSIIENSQMKGIMGDYLNLVAKRTGLTFKFIPSKSWSHVLEQFKEGKIELVPGIGSSPQELALGLISDKYANYPMVIVTNDTFTFLDNISEIDDKVFALPKHYTSYNFIKKNYPNIKIIETQDIPEALLLIEQGRADAFVGHIATSLYYLSELGLSSLKISGTTDFEFSHHYLIQEKNSILLSIINKAFASITPEERSKIYAKWVNVQFDKRIDKRILLALVAIIVFIILLFLVRQREYYKYNRKLKIEVYNKTKELQAFNQSLEQTVQERTQELNGLYVQLKESYDELEHILNSAMEAIVISKDNKVLDCNEQFIKLFGFEDKIEVQSQSLTQLFDHREHKNEEKFMKKSFKEEYEVKLQKKDGTSFFALIKSSYFRQKHKSYRITSFLDLTIIKKKEKILLQQSKMAALGEMIGNIAHQWRQPLSLISTTASGMRLKKEFKQSSEAFEMESLDSIISTTNYLSKTIDDFRNFIRGDKKLKEFYIQDVIQTLDNLIQPSIFSNHIQLIHLCQDNAKIRAYENELLQSLLNIMNNAKDALQVQPDGQRFIFMGCQVLKQELELYIYDSAGGIKEEILPKIFEPYFTTKHNASGTGIGLYMAYKMVKGMHGRISVNNYQYTYENRVFTGARFSLKFDIIP